MTRETQLPLPAAFLSVPLPPSLLNFFSFCTFSHCSFSTFPALWLLLHFKLCPLSTLDPSVVLLVPFICCVCDVISFLACCFASTETSNPPNLPLKTHRFPTAVCLSVHLSYTPHSIPPPVFFVWSPPLGLPLSFLPQ